MQVEDPADNNESPSTPKRPTPPSTQSTICISEQTIQKMCKRLHRCLSADDDYDEIRDILGLVSVIVRDALAEDPNLKPRLVNENQFKENVNNVGEQQFINLLKDIAKKGSWQDLPQNGTSFLYFDLKCSALIAFYLQTCL